MIEAALPGGGVIGTFEHLGARGTCDVCRAIGAAVGDDGDDVAVAPLSNQRRNRRLDQRLLVARGDQHEQALPCRSGRIWRAIEERRYRQHREMEDGEKPRRGDERGSRDEQASHSPRVGEASRSRAPSASDPYNVVGDVDGNVRDAIRQAGGDRVVGIPRPLLLAGARHLERRAARAWCRRASTTVGLRRPQRHT